MKFPVSVILALCSAASMVLGFLRELISARLFGVSRELDLFLLCFLPFDLLLPATRDVPVALQGRLAKQSGPQADYIVQTLAKAFLLLGLALAGVYFIAYQWIIADLIPGPIGWSWNLLLICLSISIPIALTHIPLSAIGMHRYGIVVFHGYQQIYLNAAIVGGLLTLGVAFGVVSLAIGVLVGTSMLMVHEYLRLRSGVLRCATAPRQAVDRRALLVLVGFVVVQAIGSKSAMLVERTIGLTLPAGSLSQLNYALRVWGIPVNLFVIAAIVPYANKLAQRLAAHEYASAYRLLCNVILTLSAAFVPFMLATAFFGDDIVRTLFESGKFTPGDTRAVAGLLQILLAGSLGVLLSTAAVYTMWSFDRSVAVALITWLSVLAYFAVSWPLAQAFGIRGLAVGNAIYYNLQAILLLWLLRREFKRRLEARGPMAAQ